MAQALGAELSLDAEGLEYISSAGLRVLMKLRKQVKKAVPVYNVSPEVQTSSTMIVFDVLNGFVKQSV